MVVHLLIALVLPTPRCKLSEEIRFSSFFTSIFDIFQVLLFAGKTAERIVFASSRLVILLTFIQKYCQWPFSLKKKSRMVQFYCISRDKNQGLRYAMENSFHLNILSLGGIFFSSFRKEKHLLK